ncbi:type II toxin-antitoxin system Phd/YefM family antitoxin [Porphyromonas levii]|nr:type II toxin-antitoxin system Phd/YefM family antitoxin [Porphyromonas levii]
MKDFVLTIMYVITATEFRKNQRRYFDLAENEPVFITRTGKTPIALTPVDLSNLQVENAERISVEGEKRFSEEE